MLSCIKPVHFARPITYIAEEVMLLKSLSKIILNSIISGEQILLSPNLFFDWFLRNDQNNTRISHVFDMVGVALSLHVFFFCFFFLRICYYSMGEIRFFSFIYTRLCVSKKKNIIEIQNKVYNFLTVGRTRLPTAVRSNIWRINSTTNSFSILPNGLLG